MPYVNDKGADQPAHPRSLISAFVVHCLDSIISLVSNFMCSFKILASLWSWAGLSLTWLQTPKTGFPMYIKLRWAASWQNQHCGCAPSEDSDQPGHPPSLIRVFAVRMKKSWILSYPLCAQRRLWSDWADAQVDLSLRWAHSHFVGFVTRWLRHKNLKSIFCGLYAYG